jgi:hypothetical protein
MQGLAGSEPILAELAAPSGLMRVGKFPKVNPGLATAHSRLPFSGANRTQAGSLRYINAVASSLQVYGKGNNPRGCSERSLDSPTAPDPSVSPSSQIGVLAVQFVVFKRDINILIALSVAPRRAFVDKFVFCTGRSWRPKDRLNLLLGGLFVDLIVVGAINLGNRVSVVTRHQQNA